MSRKSHWESIKSYSGLGYDISLTNVYGKEGVKMFKRFSYIRKAPVVCIQVVEHDELDDLEKFNDIIDWMYRNIEEQEKTGRYQEE